MKRVAITILTLGLITSVSADPIVFWGGDYVGATSQNLDLTRGATDNGGDRTYEYSDSAALTPTSGYTAPTGRSGAFYGAIQNSQANGTPANFAAASVTSGGAGGEDSFFRFQGGAGDSTISGLVFFKKEDFLNGAHQGTVSAGGLEGSMTLADVSATSASFRYAVLNNTQWYVSAAQGTGTGTFSVPDLGSGNWAAWDPTGAPLDAEPGTFGTAGSTLTDVQAIGYYFNVERDNNTPRFRVTEFEVIPEPGTMGMLALGALGLMLARRRRA